VAILIGGLVGVLGMLHSMGKIHIPIIDSLSSIEFNKPKVRPKRTAKVKINTKGKSKPSGKSDDLQAQIDAILDKINQGGYSSLTEQEKQTLFNNSKEI